MHAIDAGCQPLRGRPLERTQGERGRAIQARQSTVHLSMSSWSRTGVIAARGPTRTLAWASSYYLPAMLADPMAEDVGV